jgi:hypothetical protein
MPTLTDVMANKYFYSFSQSLLPNIGTLPQITSRNNKNLTQAAERFLKTDIIGYTTSTTYYKRCHTTTKHVTQQRSSHYIQIFLERFYTDGIFHRKVKAVID